MNIFICFLTALLTGCVIYPSVVCKNGTMYTKEGMTSVYTKTSMSCIEVDYFQQKGN